MDGRQGSVTQTVLCSSEAVSLQIAPCSSYVRPPHIFPEPQLLAGGKCFDLEGEKIMEEERLPHLYLFTWQVVTGSEGAGIEHIGVTNSEVQKYQHADFPVGM